jgi:hypothetical protein
LNCHWSPDIYVFSIDLYAHNESIPSADLTAVARGLILPPAGYRVHTDDTPFSEIRCGTFPDVGVERTFVAGLLTE